MTTNIQRFFIFFIGLLFCLLGCDSEEGNILQSADISSEPRQSSPAKIETSFEQNLLPILTARCAFAGCHVAGGPDDLDFSTYQTFIRGGDDGPVFIPGNAQSSDIIEEITSGRMPPGGPRLSDAEIQHFINWINQQESAADHRGDQDDDDDDDDDDDHDDDDDDDDHDDDDDDDDHDDNDDHDDHD